MNSLFGSERCGCELTSDGGPWVAHLVCAIPTWLRNFWSQSIASPKSHGSLCKDVSSVYAQKRKEKKEKKGKERKEKEPLVASASTSTLPFFLTITTSLEDAPSKARPKKHRRRLIEV